MKTLARFFKIAFLLLLFGFLLRGCIFRSTVYYRANSEGPDLTATDQNFKQFLDNQPLDKNIEHLTRRSLDLTAERLRFSAGRNETDPNRLFHTRKANCVGYANFFATTCNEMLRKAGLEKEWRARRLRGNISFLGINLHQFSKDPFFRDHDFNVVENRETGERYFVDASVRDVLGVVYVEGE